MPKNRPTIGQQNWGQVLNDHLNQLSPNGGGINFGTTAQRPSLGANDDGYTFVDTTTKELLRWNGSGWDTLIRQGISIGGQNVQQINFVNGDVQIQNGIAIVTINNNNQPVFSVANFGLARDPTGSSTRIVSRQPFITTNSSTPNGIYEFTYQNLGIVPSNRLFARPTRIDITFQDRIVNGTSTKFNTFPYFYFTRIYLTSDFPANGLPMITIEPFIISGRLILAGSSIPNGGPTTSTVVSLSPQVEMIRNPDGSTIKIGAGTYTGPRGVISSITSSPALSEGVINGSVPSTGFQTSGLFVGKSFEYNYNAGDFIDSNTPIYVDAESNPSVGRNNNLPSSVTINVFPVN